MAGGAGGEGEGPGDAAQGAEAGRAAATGPARTGPPRPADVIDEIRAQFPDALLESRVYKGETTAIIAPERIVAVCLFLKQRPDLGFVMLVDLCATHWMDREYSYEVAYLLHSFIRNERIRLVVRLGEDGTVATLTDVHPGANWHEREAYDLVGVVFTGHPDPRRILMPDDYDAFPLRKDFPVKGY